MMFKNAFIFFIFIVVGCSSNKQIYADRLIDYGNRHIYVNDSLDFAIWYFDVIGKKARQLDSLDFKKTTVPPEFQKHLKQSVKSPSEILFSAHRTSMSQEDIIAILYDKQGDLTDFSKKTITKIAQFVSKDSIEFKPFQTVSGYILGNNKAFEGSNYRGSHFMQNRPFSALRYNLHNTQSDYKIHEFHVAYDNRYTLRLIWIANARKTIAAKGWEKIDEQNHYLELFTLNDSAKFRLQEVVPESPFKIAGEAFKEHGYLGAINALKGFETTLQKKGTPQQKSMYNQAMMTYYSFFGDNNNSLMYMDKAFGAKPPMVSDSVFLNYKAINAADYILQKIDTHRIVMFNEAHNCGQNRAFLRDILRGLYDKGFHYLTFEDAKRTDSLNKRGYPLREQNGFYNVEPTFSQALREAKNIGFTIFGHDAESEQREMRQADNINKILEHHPNEKLVVWAGHSHIHEQPVGQDIVRMANYFKRFSGIDPLTIETTVLREHSKPEFESGYYRAALQKGGLSQPFVMANKDSAFVAPNLKRAVDLQVFFPRTDYTNDYPDWMSTSTTHFYELTIDKDHFKDKLLMIFLFNEYNKEIDRAIPVMNIPLSRLGVFKLFLKPDKYVAVIRDSANWEFLYKEFEVK